MNKYSVVMTLGVILTMLGTTSVYARETKFQLAPRVGMGRLHIASDHAVSRVDEQVDAIALGVTIGVVTPVDVMFEVGAFGYWNTAFSNSDDLNNAGTEDRHTVDQWTFALGYQFETDNGFLITPKVGRMSWKLSERGGHPGPEGEGTDNFWQLTLQKRLAKWFAVGVDLRGGALEFGSARSITAIATFEL